MSVTYRFKTDDQWHEVKGDGTQTLLQMSEAAQIRTPHACEEGGCGSCRCKLVSGKVEMLSNNVLEEDELANGLILACQSKAITPELVVDFDAADPYANQ